ncbi:50S ribosomal protein L34 [Candidatus Parcubacteria bacterium]|nr:50S ribosomal protein L34 [Candidatus Parcubacteria bacterium]
MAISFHPSKRKRKKTHGFLKRSKKVLRRRRKKKRWRLAP